MDPVVDLSERVDLDADMLDLGAEEREGGNHGENRPTVTGFVTRGSGFGLPLPGNSSGAQDDSSEGDGSRSASAEGVILVAGVLPGREPVISGKRKR